MAGAEKKLPLLESFLILWIFSVMAIRVGLGAVFPQIVAILGMLRLDTVSLPIAIGLLWMMYPPLARVRYEELSKAAKTWRIFSVSIIQNWIVSPFLMFFLAWTMLYDMPEYQIGLIIVGLARCIAMVLVWNMLAGGDNEYCTVLVALNSIFQIAFYSIYAYFLVTLLPKWLSPATEAVIVNISIWNVAKSVLIYLGIPFAAGIITRFSLVMKRGKELYEKRFVPKLSPTALVGLLFTIIVMFSMKGECIVKLPLAVLRVALPLAAYFLVMFTVSFIMYGH